MKNQLIVILFMQLMFFACTNSNDNSSNTGSLIINPETSPDLVGKWQGLDGKGISVEFSKEGNYYLLEKDNSRMEAFDTSMVRYSYNRLENDSKNFSLFFDGGDEHKGNIAFLDPDKIEFQLIINNIVETRILVRVDK